MRLAPTALAAVLALAAAGCASTQAPDTTGAASVASPAASPTAPVVDTPAAESPAVGSDVTPTPPAVAASAGSWVDRVDYEADAAGYHATGDVVLFFNADWCPTCQQTVRNLDAEGVPPGLTVVSVDFDSSVDLRRQYAVTVQHTFVQVDASGQPLATFTGSLTGDEIAAQTV